MRCLALLFVLAAVACGRTPPDFFPSADGGGGAESSSTGPGRESESNSDSTAPINCADAPEVCVADLSLRRAVDILFVIDNSGSMGTEQSTLARSFGTFIEVLESQQVGANYRIGITTTDAQGELRATSCRSRLDDFIFYGNEQFEDKDERQRGCLDHCALDSVGLTDPWVEKSNGQTNLPPGIDLTQALQCIGPQGIGGDGFEAPLESMRLALLDSTSGFLRADALLAVIFVTDEVDCSGSSEQIGWLRSSGSQVFWTAPDRTTSGVCWSAGVTCTGGPGVYDDCFAQDKDRGGGPTTDPDAAVLYPVQRYVDTLTELAASKQLMGGQSEVVVAVLAGVPVDYPETGVHLFAESSDSAFNEEYGIGPACNRGTETVDDPPGIPSVRLRELAEAFASEGPNIFSVCAEDYGVAVQGIADTIGDISTRACVGGCVSDQRYDVQGFQPACTLVETFADGLPDREVLPCPPTDWGWDFPAPDVHVCYRALTDPGLQTTTAIDDMSPQCVTLRANLELVVERREGIPVPSGTAVNVRCELDAPVGVTCDEI